PRGKRELAVEMRGRALAETDDGVERERRVVVGRRRDAAVETAVEDGDVRPSAFDRRLGGNGLSGKREAMEARDRGAVAEPGRHAVRRAVAARVQQRLQRAGA